MSLTPGEVKTLRFNTRYDLSGVIALTLDIFDTDGQKATIATGLNVGVVDVVGEDGLTYKANEYIEYLTAATDFPVDGQYYLKLHADFGVGKKLKSFKKSLVVQA